MKVGTSHHESRRRESDTITRARCSCFFTNSPLTGIINSLRLKRYVMPPHFMIDKYFSEQSSVKVVALQVCPWICAVAAAQASARVAARRRLRSQRRRMSVCSRSAALATRLFICHKYVAVSGEHSSDSLDARESMLLSDTSLAADARLVTRPAIYP